MSRCNTDVVGSGEACKPFTLLADCQSEYGYREVVATKVVVMFLVHLENSLTIPILMFDAKKTQKKIGTVIEAGGERKYTV
jgi:hypothetical protein